MERQTDSIIAAVLKRLQEANLDVLLLSEFTRAAPVTVTSWLGKGQPPLGERLNRLQHLLHILGIESPELERVSPWGFYVGRLLALGMIDLSEAQHILGVNHKEAVFDTIRGIRNPDNPNMVSRPVMSLRELRKKYDIRVVISEEAWRQRFGTSGQEPTGTIAPEDGKAYLAVIASQLAAVTPLVRYLLDDCTPEDRECVNRLMGNGGIFVLTEILIGLCGEHDKQPS